MNRGTVILLALAILLPSVAMTPVWRLGGLGAMEDDVLYYYPSRVFFHESIGAGEVPWIDPWTGLGRPYVADPQSAFFYPFTWVFALLEPGAAYAALLWLHYVIAFAGMYRLLRGQRLSRAAAPSKSWWCSPTKAVASSGKTAISGGTSYSIVVRKRCPPWRCSPWHWSYGGAAAPWPARPCHRISIMPHLPAARGFPGPRSLRFAPPRRPWRRR